MRNDVTFWSVKNELVIRFAKKDQGFHFQAIAQIDHDEFSVPRNLWVTKIDTRSTGQIYRKKTLGIYICTLVICLSFGQFFTNFQPKLNDFPEKVHF